MTIQSVKLSDASKDLNIFIVSSHLASNKKDHKIACKTIIKHLDLSHFIDLFFFGPR